MPHEPNHQSGSKYQLKGPQYTEPDFSIGPEPQEEEPKFSIFMPDYLSDMFKSGYNQSITANAIHLSRGCKKDGCLCA